MRQLSSAVLTPDVLRALVCGGAIGCAHLLGGGQTLGARQHPGLGPGDTIAEACLACHDEVKQAMETKPHKAVEDGCLTCHEVAKGGRAPYLRAEADTICTSCHRQGSSSESAAAAPVSMPERLLPTPRDLGGGGHPVANHPVGGVPDPLRPGRLLSCLSCHVPHGGAMPMLLKFSSRGSGICGQCHNV